MKKIKPACFLILHGPLTWLRHVCSLRSPRLPGDLSEQIIESGERTFIMKKMLCISSNLKADSFNMNPYCYHRGFSLMGILISLVCIVVLMSLYMTSMQKAVTGGTGVSSETSLWGMQDQIQLQTLAQGLTIHAMTSGDQFLIPSKLSRSNDPFDNTSANFWSAMIMQNLAKPEQLVSPYDRGWVEEAEYRSYGGDWDPNFSADLQTTSNVSYAHMPLFGDRLERRWNPSAGRFPILGNRGPQDGTEGTSSMTLDADGTWRGWVVFADGSIEWQEGTSIVSKWRRRDGYVNDNLFLIEEDDSSDDAILGFTYEMDDYGPVFVWD